MAIIVPSKLIEAKNLKENDEIIIEVVKKADISDIFGTLKLDKKMSGQEFKDMAREGWETKADKKRREEWEKMKK